MLSTTIHSRFAAINAACEASARDEIDAFHKSARYEGSKFTCPSFAEVGKVWLKLIQRKEEQLIAEARRQLEATAVLDEDQLGQIVAFAEDLFKEAHYTDRLKVFSEGVARTAASYGVQFAPKNYRLDLADAAYRAGVKNLLRASLSNLATEISIYVSQRDSKMRLSSLMTDTVSLLKKNGERTDGIKASVQTNKIFISGSSYLIESGDLIQRKMSNGGEETFEVTDPGFREKFHSIPAGYQMVVKKLGIPEAKNAVQNITYNIAGHNARINQNSIDNSSNVVNVNPDVVECINALRSAVTSVVLRFSSNQACG